MAYRFTSSNRPRSTNFDDDHHHSPHSYLHHNHHHNNNPSSNHDHHNGHEQRGSRYSSSPSLNSSSYRRQPGSSTGSYTGSGVGGVGGSRSFSSGSANRPSSFSSGYGSGYTSPGYVSPVLSPTCFRYTQSPPPPPPPPRTTSRNAESLRLFSSTEPHKMESCTDPSDHGSSTDPVKTDSNTDPRDMRSSLDPHNIGSSTDPQDMDSGTDPEENTELERSIEYHQAPDTFPCGHVLCHHCLRSFIKSLSSLSQSEQARCPVCRVEVSGEDVTLASMGLHTEHQAAEEAEEESDSTHQDHHHHHHHGQHHDHDHDNGDHHHDSQHHHHHHHHHHHRHQLQQQQQQDQEAPISLLSNFDDIVKKFKGIQQSLRRLKDESVHSRSMGMTYTNTVCDLCRQSHPTLRVIQEYNQLEVRHERPPAWRNNYFFYKLQHGKVVTTFYSKVNAATICVPCTYRQLTQAKAILPPEHKDSLPGAHPSTDEEEQQLALTEVGKLMAKNTAPLMALRGKNVMEVDHRVRVRERADNFDFADTTEQIERMVRSQEENLLRHATRQVRDTGQLYHVQHSNHTEVDNDETIV